jgi:uncharacterized protein (TIGR02145 family)
MRVRGAPAFFRRDDKMIKLAIVLSASVIAVTGGVQPPATITDPRDGTAYPIVEIAGMAWLARNLAIALPSSSCPNGDEQACRTMGRLYPWHVAVSACPAGWHLSTEEEWQRLERHLGMAPAELSAERLRGTGLGDLLKTGGSTRLEIPLAGWRRPDGAFRVGNGNDRAAALWVATKANDTEAWHRDLSSARSGIWRSPVPLDYSLSVRCVRNSRK